MSIRRSMWQSAVAALLAGPCASAAMAQDPLALIPVRADQLMTPAELERSGLARLTPAERIVLDGLTADDDAGGEERAGTQGRRPFRMLPLPITAPPGSRLAATLEEGNYLRLADGTLWEVYLPDRTATVTWQRGDYIAVSRAPAGVGEYDHVLANAPHRTRAHARFAGLARRP